VEIDTLHAGKKLKEALTQVALSEKELNEQRTVLTKLQIEAMIFYQSFYLSE